MNEIVFKSVVCTGDVCATVCATKHVCKADISNIKQKQKEKSLTLRTRQLNGCLTWLMTSRQTVPDTSSMFG